MSRTTWSYQIPVDNNFRLVRVTYIVGKIMESTIGNHYESHEETQLIKWEQFELLLVFEMNKDYSWFT